MKVKQAQNRIESYHRAYQIHQHTFGAISDYSSENLFWSITGGVFKLLTLIIIYPMVFITVGIIKLINKSYI